MSEKPTPIVSGEWRQALHRTDYRVELLDDLLVERVTWDVQAPELHLGNRLIAAPGYVWFRFWFAEGEQVIEKYFNHLRQPLGYYMPISSQWRRHEMQWGAVDLLLAVWLDTEGRLTVLREELFEQAMADDRISPVEAEHAEQRIRRLTTSIVQKRIPPPMVRNFAI